MVRHSFCCLSPCVEFFLSTALSGIDNSLHDYEAVNRGVISQGIGQEFCGYTHFGDKMRKAARKTPVQQLQRSLVLSPDCLPLCQEFREYSTGEDEKKEESSTRRPETDRSQRHPVNQSYQLNPLQRCKVKPTNW